jgi:glycosyltransferase involved in cell wall biosynthesis
VDHVSAVGLAAGGLDTKVVWHVQTTFRSSFDPGAVAAADAIVTVSPAVLARLSGIEPQKRRLEVPNAVDTQRFAPGDDAELRRERGVPPDAPLLLYAGSLEPLKGTLDLVRAFARIHADLPSARLWLVGSAESAFEEPLSRALRESGVASAVDRVGSRSDIERFYRAADLFVFPSHAEGGPLALLEAMASGLACLGSDAPGVKQLLDDGRGRTTPIGDDAAFAREALALLRDRASRQKLAERARAHVLEHHRLDQFVAAFERLFLELTGERRSA